ncbi:hypothetical protein EJ06DRAFT_215725 [Trichodelitschia bisporula]|uniref:Uncharacterized protein n=1 Tax=Trichodelitschia bisporula TaxID=703511 RepID=A0A6G1I9D8_9PEZI|nr:hypothetical protein EJ06DRAFT_215725 [Trichodelitschia bisporula]
MRPVRYSSVLPIRPSSHSQERYHQRLCLLARRVPSRCCFGSRRLGDKRMGPVDCVSFSFHFPWPSGTRRSKRDSLRPKRREASKAKLRVGGARSGRVQCMRGVLMRFIFYAKHGGYPFFGFDTHCSCLILRVVACFFAVFLSGTMVLGVKDTALDQGKAAARVCNGGTLMCFGWQFGGGRHTAGGRGGFHCARFNHGRMEGDVVEDLCYSSLFLRWLAESED